jgi:RNA polymerase-binding protein DksA
MSCDQSADAFDSSAAAGEMPDSDASAAGAMPEAVMSEAIRPAATAARRGKSPLSEQELEEFRTLLLAKRRDLIATIGRLHGGMAEAKIKDEIRSDEIEAAIENETAEMGVGFLSTEMDQLRQINEALNRIADGTYGICASAKHPIGLARLRALPWACQCIEHAKKQERRGRR